MSCLFGRQLHRETKERPYEKSGGNLCSYLDHLYTKLAGTYALSKEYADTLMHCHTSMNGDSLEGLENLMRGMVPDELRCFCLFLKQHLFTSNESTIDSPFVILIARFSNISSCLVCHHTPGLHRKQYKEKLLG